MAPVRTLVVWCPDWPVVAAGHRPDEPVVVVEANVVVACSAAARGVGVRRGLRRREAQGRCPEALVLASDAGRDARAFEPVVVAVEAFVPGVEIVRPGVCAFATRGPSRYFGGDDALAGRVAAAVDAVLGGDGRCRVGVADGVFAATLAARRGAVVPPGGTAAFLAPFPLAALDVPDLADLLRRLGVRTLGELAALPARDVLARFGPAGAAASRLARGLDERPPAARVPPSDLTVTAELDPPLERVDAAAFAGKALADELCAHLAARGLACARVRIEAETEHGESLARLWRHDGGLTPAALAERVRWQLDGWLASTRSRPPGPAAGATTAGLTLLRLIPDEVVPDRGRQQGFWGAGAADGRAGRALARLQGLLGPEAVVTAVPAGGRGPAERVRLVPWGDAREPAAEGDGSPPWPGAVPPPAPATVHPTPVPAEVVLARAAPARVSVAGGPWADVVGWAGPWPVEERWWDAAAARRLARWQVATADGGALLLAAVDGRWAVEATYD